MILEAFTAASVAFKGVKALVEAGREIEDVVGQMGKWYTAVADFTASAERSKNPPLFKKILHSKSVEQEAMDIFAQEKAIQKQNNQLREMITLVYGLDAWKELIYLRRKIREERSEMIKAQLKRRRKFVENVFYGIILTISLGIAAWLGLVTVELVQNRN
jgi:hypothetical protein